MQCQQPMSILSPRYPPLVNCAYVHGIWAWRSSCRLHFEEPWTENQEFISQAFQALTYAESLSSLAFFVKLTSFSLILENLTYTNLARLKIIVYEGPKFIFQQS